MKDWTHIYYEGEKGWPQDGQEVLVEGALGDHQLMRIIETSRIHTGDPMSGAPSYIYLKCTESDRYWDDLGDEEAAEAWESLCHVTEIEDENE